MRLEGERSDDLITIDHQPYALGVGIIVAFAISAANVANGLGKRHFKHGTAILFAFANPLGTLLTASVCVI